MPDSTTDSMTTPASWVIPTLADHFPTLGEAAYVARVVTASPVQNHAAACERCGRRTAADMLVDVRALDLDQRAVIGLVAEAFICDACTQLLVLTTGVSRAELCRALGAPDDTVAAIVAAETPTSTTPSDASQ